VAYLRFTTFTWNTFGCASFGINAALLMLLPSGVWLSVVQRWPDSWERPLLMVSYQNLLASSARSVALRLTDFFFLSVCLCEEAFSQMMIIKSRYLSLFTEEHLKCCLHLCLSNYKPFSNKVSQVVQCRASTLQ